LSGKVERRNLTKCRWVILLRNENIELNRKETGFGNLDYIALTQDPVYQGKGKGKGKAVPLQAWSGP